MIALRERNFRLYLLGQAVSNIGNWMQVVALGWFVLQLTGSSLALGLLGLAQFLPVLLLSLAGGILADRFLRLHLLMVTQGSAMILAVVFTLLALMGRPPLWSLLLVAALSATVTAIDNPARQAFLFDLVGKDKLLNAVSLNASVYNGAAVIGPSLAGLLLLKVGAAVCFLLNALSFLAVLIALAIIAVGNTHLVDARGISRAGLNDGIRPSFRAFGLLRHELALLALLGIAAATSLLGRPYLLLMPAFARSVQHVGPQGLGIMVAASGFGSLLGALLLASLQSSKQLERLLLITGVGFGFTLTVLALTSNFVLALLILICCGAGATMTMTAANTLLQMYSHPARRGRVMSLYTLIAAGFTPLGALVITGLGTKIGLESATVAAGTGVIVAIIAGYRLLRLVKA